MKILTFKSRFVPEHLLPELSNLWHLSRVPHHSRYDRMSWTSREFSKAHPEISATAAYKDLDGMLSVWWCPMTNNYVFEHQGKAYTPDGQTELAGQSAAEHNQELSRAEVEWFKREKPSRHFAYVRLDECSICNGIPEKVKRFMTTSTTSTPCCHLYKKPVAVTTWTGEVLGHVVWCGRAYRIPAFGAVRSVRQNLRVRAVNGLIYSAVYYKSSGDYCRMKVISSSKHGQVQGANGAERRTK